MSSDSVRVWRDGGHRDFGAEKLLGHSLFVFAFSMSLMAVHAIALGDGQTSIVFALSGAGCFLLAAASQMILMRNPIRAARSGLLVLILFYAFGPFLAAIPVAVSVNNLGLINAYFEMSSAITTTGASAFRDIEMIPKTVVMWRSFVAGLGGFVCLVSALAILAPLSIGGFEVRHSIEETADSVGQGIIRNTVSFERRTLEERVIWATRLLLVPYCAVTLFCAMALTAVGVHSFDALCYALGAVSTTGFVPNAGGLAAYELLAGELIIACVIIFAAIGVGVHVQAVRGKMSAYRHDPEVRYLFIIVSAVVAMLFMRHWIGAIETRSTDELDAGFSALWGSLFMAISYATTTGFESADWQGATAWSGLRTPGVALIGLAIIGGGAASTAGGVKLVRAVLLAKHSANELAHLTRPMEVRPIRSGGQKVTADAMRIVFVFVMLYVLALVVSALALSMTGIETIDAMIASVSVLSNTGPAFPLLSEDNGAFVDLPSSGKLILCVGMIVGRMETLAVVALLSPAAWRQ